MRDRLRHLIITKLLGMQFCDSCSGYFHPLCFVTVDLNGEAYARCETCYAQAYGHLIRAS